MRNRKKEIEWFRKRVVNPVKCQMFKERLPKVFRKVRFTMPVLLIMVMIGSACSSHHYFSINAEEITNPEIIYSDSTHVTNPF